MIQCARQPGLASVWESIMGFDGARNCRTFAFVTLAAADVSWM
jgi:hypothetical protein